MLRDVRSLTSGRACAIHGLGRSVLPASMLYTNERFILDEQRGLSLVGRNALFSELVGGQPSFGGLSQAELVTMAVAKFESQTGIRSRYIFDGSLTELASLAARDALERSGSSTACIEAVLVGTNTPDEYNIANGVKHQLGLYSGAYCNTMMAACPVGANVVYEGWQMVRHGEASHVLVIGAERATTLASHDLYRASNLFGDAAFAMVLGPSDTEAFEFFAYGSDPSDGKIEWIRKSPNGFAQDGKRVHKYVGDVLVAEVDRVLSALGINPASIDHVFPHQASVKTNELFETNLSRRWPDFHGRFHSNVARMGNTSAASTGWMMAEAQAKGELVSGQRCLVLSFGAGMSYSFYLFRVS